MKCLLLMLLLPVLAVGQDQYKAIAIPTGLRDRADAVVRLHETTFTVKSPGQAVQTVHSVVTVLKPAGDDHAKRVVPYDKFDRIADLEGTLYDENGVVIKKLKKADIEDYSSYNDINFYDDNRYKVAQFPRQPSYPYTVEFRIVTASRNLMFYPQWQPQQADAEAVERATFVVDMPPNLALRYKVFNLPEPRKTPGYEPGRIQYSWQVENLAARESEPSAPPRHELRPSVFTAPTEFEVQDYRGNLRTWNDLGQFYNTLNVNRDALPDDVRQRVVTLAATEKTTAAKVKKVYELLQEQTRYVGIQLGIGGWQTIDAKTVANTKYGDCKALTNYTKAMLKAVGIPAWEALVRAGDDEPDVLTDFPSFQFNHVILYVPDGRDTLWLECTSQDNPVGYMSDFTGSRHALLMTPTGGKLINTPVYRPADNRQNRRVAVTLTETGDATATASSDYTGLQHDTRADALHQMNQTDQKSWLLKQIRIPTFDLTAFSLSEQKSRVPAITEQLTLTIRRWATPSGTRLFLPLNVLSASPALPMPTQPRVAPLVLGPEWDFVDTDTVTIRLPTGYAPEFALEPQTIESKFGRYTAQARVEGDKLTYVRQWQMHRGRYPATEYAAWVEFRKKIAKADKAQMVLVKP